MGTNSEQENARETTGKFGTQHNTAPEVTLEGPAPISKSAGLWQELQAKVEER
jgi:hypothetical protein